MPHSGQWKTVSTNPARSSAVVTSAIADTLAACRLRDPADRSGLGPAERARAPAAVLLDEGERGRGAGVALAHLRRGGIAVDLHGADLQVVVAGVLDGAVHLGHAVPAGALDLGDELRGEDLAADLPGVAHAAGGREVVDHLRDPRLVALVAARGLLRGGPAGGDRKRERGG